MFLSYLMFILPPWCRPTDKRATCSVPTTRSMPRAKVSTRCCRSTRPRRAKSPGPPSNAGMLSWWQPCTCARWRACGRSGAWCRWRLRGEPSSRRSCRDSRSTADRARRASWRSSSPAGWWGPSVRPSCRR